MSAKEEKGLIFAWKFQLRFVSLLFEYSEQFGVVTKE